MKGSEQSPRILFKSLQRKQRKHEALLSKVEKTTAQLERQRGKLGTLEGRIAELERRVVEPRRQANGQGDAGLQRAQLIFNPASGRDDENNADRLSRVVSSLREHGIQADIGLKTSGKAARALADKAVRAGHSLVVVAAGDGTIGDVAARLIGTSTVLGIVPIGTMNNVARSLGVPLDIDDACALIGMGTTRHIDMGRVVSTANPKPEYFLECAGVGLSAVAAAAGQAFEKRHWRMLPAALRKFFEAKLGAVTIEMDGVAVAASTRIVTVSNAPLMGNNMLAAPEARMDDGFLDVHVYDGMGDAALVKHFSDASSGSPDGLKSYRARRVTITAVEAMASNADMNLVEAQHVVDIDIVPRALSMIVGNGIGLSLPVASAPSAPTFAVEPPHTNGSAKIPVSTPTPMHSEL
jgi:diacylglycerol kinase (ATP)